MTSFNLESEMNQKMVNGRLLVVRASFEMIRPLLPALSRRAFPYKVPLLEE